MFLLLVFFPLSYGLILQVDDTAKLEPNDDDFSEFLPDRIFPYLKYMNMPREEGVYQKEEEYRKSPIPYYGSYVSGEMPKQEHVAPSETVVEVDDGYYLPKTDLLRKLGKEIELN